MDAGYGSPTSICLRRCEDGGRERAIFDRLNAEHQERKKLEKELADLKSEADALQARWQNEKGAVQRVRALREQIEQTKIEIERAERQYDLNRAAELKYGKLTELQKKLEEESQAAAGSQRLMKEEVDEHDIAAIVSRWTGIPVSKLLEGEMQKPQRSCASRFCYQS